MARFDTPSWQSMVKTVLLASLVFTVPIVAIRFLGGFVGAELAAYDDFIARRPAEPPDDRIVIVTISDTDIETLQQYPIHDETFAAVLETLESYKPRAIGLDISRDVPQGPPGGRKRLTQAISNSEVVVSGCLLSTENHPGSPPAPGTLEGGAAFADFSPDPDLVVRRVRLVSTPAPSKKTSRTQHICNDAQPDNEIPSLSFQMALMYLGSEGINPDATATGDIQFHKQVLARLTPNSGSYARAEVNDYQMLLNYRGTGQVFQEIPITDVVKKRVDPEAIRDRVVLIGNSSEVSKDFLATPYIDTQLGSRNMLGVVVHAHGVSQILSAVLDRRPLIQSWSEVAEVLWIWAWSLGSGVIAFYNRRLGLFLVVLIVSGVALWGICYGLLLSQGLWVPFVPVLVAAMLTALGIRIADLAGRSGYAQALYGQMQEQLRGAASRDRKGDYLENLVRRARAVRQGQDAVALAALEDEPDPLATPEMKRLYDQIASRVRQDIAAEQSAQQSAMLRSRTSGSKANRLQALLSRAKRSHGAAGNSKPSERSHE